MQAICVRLDGLPLAIELAAAQLLHYPLATILARLDQRLAFLINGPRDAEARHQTLVAAIGWSYELLDPDAQRFFVRLSVLVDGWTMEAMVAICGADLPVARVDQLLQTLCDYHLVEQRGGQDARQWGMLETIRAYAAERLAAGGGGTGAA